ncbi:MAG: hypothetical protein RMK29_01700 [Myxococcales bacterium]|nr:hypothetical protein [Myxococcota bacterium]MDW8280394.1 hypothetical protein [Myxococcales bacterium]
MRPALLLWAILLPACLEIGTDRCRDTLCPLGQRCDEDSGQCVADDLCAGVLCPAGLSCDPADGTCRGGSSDPCRGVTCSETESCDPQTGRCTPNPPPPTLSPTIIDRIGRPGISHLLLNPFGLFRVNNMPEQTAVSQDKYNADGQPGRWTTAFSPYLRFNLGIFDAMDGICGNQVLAAAALNASRYNALANLLSADMLQLNTSAVACSAFLAVEFGAADCGGRRPTYDVIDTLYTLLITGTPITPVGDGVSSTTQLSDLFPFLPPPP